MNQKKHFLFNKEIFFLIIVFLNNIFIVKLNEIPLNIIPGLFDSTKIETMNLKYAPGCDTFNVYSSKEIMNIMLIMV